MARTFGKRNASADSRQIHVTQRGASVLTGSALDMWDQLVTLHYGGRKGICSHFRASTIAANGLAWAGAPFSDPAAAATFANSVMTVTLDARAFAYQTMASGNTYDKLCSVALGSVQAGNFAGLRLDDGSDNNYLEVVLYLSQGSPTQWDVRTRRRTGGGAVTTQDGDALASDPGYVLRMDLGGTKWTAWNAAPVLHTNMGFGGLMSKPAAYLGAVDLAFTPTRAGVVFSLGDGGGATGTARVDWLDIGRSITPA